MMSAFDIVTRRLGITLEEAEPYVQMAEEKVRLYCKNNDIKVDSGTKEFAIADIAALYYQQDSSIKQAQASMGYDSESWSEGGVSHNITAMSGSAIREQYASAINDVLEDLDSSRHRVVFL